MPTASTKAAGSSTAIVPGTSSFSRADSGAPSACRKPQKPLGQTVSRAACAHSPRKQAVSCRTAPGSQAAAKSGQIRYTASTSDSGTVVSSAWS